MSTKISYPGTARCSALQNTKLRGNVLIAFTPRFHSGFKSPYYSAVTHLGHIGVNEARRDTPLRRLQMSSGIVEDYRVINAERSLKAKALCEPGESLYGGLKEVCTRLLHKL